MVSATHPALPPCVRRDEAGCLAAWVSLPDSEIRHARTLLDRALVWDANGDLQNLHGLGVVFSNPILGSYDGRAGRLGANASRGQPTPPVLSGRLPARRSWPAVDLSARCEGGSLRVSSPGSVSIKPGGSWTDHRMAPGFNLFYAELTWRTMRGARVSGGCGAAGQAAALKPWRAASCDETRYCTATEIASNERHGCTADRRLAGLLGTSRPEPWRLPSWRLRLS